MDVRDLKSSALRRLDRLFNNAVLDYLGDHGIRFKPVRWYNDWREVQRRQGLLGFFATTSEQRAGLQNDSDDAQRESVEFISFVGLSGVIFADGKEGEVESVCEGNIGILVTVCEDKKFVIRYPGTLEMFEVYCRQAVQNGESVDLSYVALNCEADKNQWNSLNDRQEFTFS